MPENKSLNITIVGTGYVGLTTGVSLAYLGHKVTCVDTNPAVISKLKEKTPTIYEHGLEELLHDAYDNLKFSTSLKDYVNSSDVIFICVGTPTKDNGDADTSGVEAVAREIGKHLEEKGQSANSQSTADTRGPVVVNKSTVPVGTQERVKAVIERSLKERNTEATFYTASVPEFLREGVAILDTLYPDRIVIGTDYKEAEDTLETLYKPLIDQNFKEPEAVKRPENYPNPAFIKTDPRSAELIKYAANAFLPMKISFINEIANLAEKLGADIDQVAKGIGSDSRISASFLGAGVGWGGSCFGKDTRALLYMAGEYGEELGLIKQARKTNYAQRMLLIEKLREELNILRGKTIAILGLSFKPGTDDLRDSPALDIIDKLLELGAFVKVYDPKAMDNFKEEYPDMEVDYARCEYSVLDDAHALMLITDWPEFKELDFTEANEKMKEKIVIDGRNIYDKEELESKGFVYRGVGR
ncbi:UDP-glucose dehydrogenase family protein [Natranaerofaba carboxydovora]|uniref:UDP-glucose dehydrogenase family protein n=1 Tax=Natranaerofaba carboxydovora TaxID=2742683 RepID=UPI001F12A9A4|nr:UDP-glucose/GDP-mannose dehydrogenase family protein [Natranaerofaba carboxydovora]UMZ74737.1 UDP-glucose 6-dehydrogenase TuaD [Natranaerofaba carboxydovora]